tara:strand:- start:121 stop:468 length:348 start_codon:yes stop_codon:yes gene_type:complete
MAFIQYFSEASSESLTDSYVGLLENYGMLIPQSFEHSKQLFAEFKSKNNNNFSKVNLLISWVNQSQKKCSIEIWSDEPFSKEETLCKKVHQDISKIIKPSDISSKGESYEINRDL